jgi:hypothetical protein
MIPEGIPAATDGSNVTEAASSSKRQVDRARWLTARRGARGAGSRPKRRLEPPLCSVDAWLDWQPSTITPNSLVMRGGFVSRAQIWSVDPGYADIGRLPR